MSNEEYLRFCRLMDAIVNSKAESDAEKKAVEAFAAEINKKSAFEVADFFAAYIKDEDIAVSRVGRLIKKWRKIKV